jgi:hypothetical protein
VGPGKSTHASWVGVAQTTADKEIATAVRRQLEICERCLSLGNAHVKKTLKVKVIVSLAGFLGRKKIVGVTPINLVRSALLYVDLSLSISTYCKSFIERTLSKM